MLIVLVKIHGTNSFSGFHGRCQFLNLFTLYIYIYIQARI